MASLPLAVPLTPLPIKYVPDASLPEGRVLLPFLLDFSIGNNIDPTGTFYTSTKVVQTAAVQSTTIQSPVKGICIRYNTFNNQVLKIRCLETNADWVIGVPVMVTPGSQNFILNARIPMFLPQNSTLYITNYSLASDPPTTNQARVQLCNFEIEYGLEVVLNPFGNNI